MTRSESQQTYSSWMMNKFTTKHAVTEINTADICMQQKTELQNCLQTTNQVHESISYKVSYIYEKMLNFTVFTCNNSNNFYDTDY